MDYDDLFEIQQVGCPGGILYRIQAGDTLYILARRFGTTVNRIVAANPGIDPLFLRIGDTICIPVEDGGECPSGAVPYTIQAGDTFYLIARRLGVTVQTLINLNPGVDPNRLRIGQRICIPSGAPPEPEFPELCSAVLRPNPEGPAPQSGGVFWIRQDNSTQRVIVAAVDLPDPTSLGADRYVAALSWGMTAVDIPLSSLPDQSVLWAASSQESLPADFFEEGSVDIYLDPYNGEGPVMGTRIEECR